MTRTSRIGLMLAIAAAAATPSAQQPPPPSQPTFRAATDLIAIDATVIDERGQPVADLMPEDFTLTIDGQPRRVVSAQFIRQDPPGPPPTLAGRRLPFTTNESAVGGRLILLVFDLEGIGIGGGRGAAVAAGRFLDQLTPADRVGLLAFPNGANVDFTTDRDQLRKSLMRVVGRGTVFTMGTYNIGVREAFDIDRGDSIATERVYRRECANEGTEQGVQICQNSVQSQARGAALEHRQRATNSVQTLRSLLNALGKIDAPKTIVWISEGLTIEENRVEFGGMAALAATARTTIYSLHLDQSVIADASRSTLSPTLVEDRQLAIDGLATIAGITRGAMFTSIGTGSNVFERIAKEMTAYYLLSAEAEAGDRDGKSHRIRVNVTRRNVNVRARREFTMKKEPAVPLSPEQRLAGILQQPLLATELPVKVATYNLRKPGSQAVKVVVTTEFGRNAVGGEDASIGYLVLDEKGKVIASAVTRNKAVPVRAGAPGPLQATSVVDVPPGRYTLRLAVLDAVGRSGSVEHRLDAAVMAAGGLEVADLLLAPASVGNAAAVRLVADPTVEHEPFGAYLEVYPRSADAVRQTSVVVEVAETDDAPAIGLVKAQLGETSEKGRYIAQAILPLALVPPGEYIARAVVTIGSDKAVQVRPFRLLKAVPAGDMFRAELAARVGAFTTAQAVTPALLGPAVASARTLSDPSPGDEAGRVAADVSEGRLDALDSFEAGSDASLLAVFLKGLRFYKASKYEDAAREFRASIRLSSEFLPGIFYLGACYASGGRGREAVGAWQTSLIGDDSRPEVFELLADGFLRLGDTDAAISAIEEAATKWPDDQRFVMRAVLALAAQDKPGDALQRLLPWLDRQPGDEPALDLAIRLALADLATRQEGSEVAAIDQLHKLVERYRAGSRPVPAVATRWLAYLAGRPGSTAQLN
jgi:VWFA-related protein